MRIIQLTWLSKAAKEAELIISHGLHECLVFSQPCFVQLNEIYTAPLHAIDIENLMKVNIENAKEKIVRLNDSYFSQYCVARVVDIYNGLVKVGEILIEFDFPIPGWANEGDLIEFKCSRIDIW